MLRWFAAITDRIQDAIIATGIDTVSTKTIDAVVLFFLGASFFVWMILPDVDWATLWDMIRDPSLLFDAVKRGLS